MRRMSVATSGEIIWEQAPQRGLFGEMSYILDEFEKEGHGHLWSFGFDAFFDKVDMGDGTYHWRVVYTVEDSEKLVGPDIKRCIEHVRAIEAVVALRNAAGGRQLC